MKNKIKIFDIYVDEKILDFVNNAVLKELDINADSFWKGFSNLINKFISLNKALLDKRKNLQKLIDKWHQDRIGKEIDIAEYQKFLFKIGYIVDEGSSFKIDTKNTDPEICLISGPQLVVPITNARYALNAVNARWGSLYDAVYGSNVLGSLPESNIYDSNRGRDVIEYSRSYLDKNFALKKGSWKNIEKLELDNDKILFHLQDKTTTLIEDNNQIVGYKLNATKELNELIFVKNNLHVRIIINPNDSIGKKDSANISDIILESAVSTILDCEDSVATVDTEDKILAYKNWLGLMKGDLNIEFQKKGKKINRSLNSNIEYFSLNNEKKFLKGRSLMLIRNVGHLMTTTSILDKDSNAIGEGIMDAMITSVIAMYDFKKKNEYKNSIYNSIYIVKPKMHGPDETAFTDLIFSKVEKVLNLPKYTCKIGIMDEERRTSANLKECIRSLKNRVFFINTGFLDRTGDEMHTSMEAGPMIKKGDMKSSKWITAYENNNVDIGLSCGFSGKAQIGKGMWAMPDKMKDMMEQKTGHLKAGANCAWVPSPTAAALHALHYHEINIFNEQKKLIDREPAKLDDLLTIPIADRPNWSVEDINKEISNSAQTLLGYVVRWVDQGVGCSKVPDINNIGLMEDRATLRISSQHIANWIHHGITTKIQVTEIMKEMAKIVDNQNKDDPLYIKMSGDYENSIAFKTACDLVFKGKEQPSGYTEPLLHLDRLIKKN